MVVAVVLYIMIIVTNSIDTISVCSIYTNSESFPLHHQSYFVTSLVIKHDLWSSVEDTFQILQDAQVFT